MTTNQDLAAQFLERSRYYLRTEYRTKLREAVRAIPADQLWSRPNEESNSVGNLLLHLAGNVRQWIVGGVGQQPNERDRSSEFAARQGAGSAELLARLDRVLDEADAVLGRLTAADLASRRTIQDREVSVMEAIYHVVEHFSLHLGQIILIAKTHAGGAVRFYEDAGGMARPIWKERIVEQHQ